MTKSKRTPYAKPKRKELSAIYKRVLVISDLHKPYTHPDADRFIAAAKKKFKPDLVVSSGDETDYHNMSFHSSDPNLPSASDELKMAIKGLQPLYKLFPKMKILESNHGSMVARKAIAEGFPEQVFKSYNEVLQAPKGWEWVPDLIIKTPLGPVYFCHGKKAAGLSSQYGMSSVQGHFHEKSYVQWSSTPERLMFDMVVGCLADDKSRALAYNKINPKRPIMSIGVIIDGIAQIVPMVLKKNGDWIGKI